VRGHKSVVVCGQTMLGGGSGNRIGVGGRTTGEFNTILGARRKHKKEDKKYGKASTIKRKEKLRGEKKDTQELQTVRENHLDGPKGGKNWSGVGLTDSLKMWGKRGHEVKSSRLSGKGAGKRKEEGGGMGVWEPDQKKNFSQPLGRRSRRAKAEEKGRRKNAERQEIRGVNEPRNTKHSGTTGV